MVEINKKYKSTRDGHTVIVRGVYPHGRKPFVLVERTDGTRRPLPIAGIECTECWTPDGLHVDEGDEDDEGDDEDVDEDGEDDDEDGEGDDEDGEGDDEGDDE
jgi:hypothetical protein